jgi:hypothetical protein
MTTNERHDCLDEPGRSRRSLAAANVGLGMAEPTDTIAWKGVEHTMESRDFDLIA